MHSIRPRLFLIIALVLAAAVAGTWGAWLWQAGRMQEADEARQEAAANSALGEAEELFERSLQDLASYAGDLAREIGRSPELLQGGASSDALARMFAGLDLPQWWSVEAYDSSGRLLAWKGRSFPLTLGVAGSTDRPVSAVAQDGDWRRAVVVWNPVADSSGKLGAVRAVQVIGARYAVQNHYVRDYDILGSWQSRIRLPVEFTFGRTAPEGTGSRPLYGLGGGVLGHVTVLLPGAEELRAQSRRKFADVMAFWATLLVGWLLFGAWTLVRMHPGRLDSLVAFGLLWWLGRFGLLFMDVPARWQLGKAPLNPLFDPAHLSSMLGAGLLRTSADVLITALFAIVFALVVQRAVLHRHGGLSPQRCRRIRPSPGLCVKFLACAVIGSALFAVLAVVVRRVMLDSGLDFFARDGLLPAPLVLVAFSSLLLLTVTAILLTSGMFIAALGSSDREPAGEGGSGLLAVLAAALPVVAVAVWFDLQGWIPWTIAGPFFAVSLSLAVAGFGGSGSGRRWITLRRVLPSAFVLAVLLYPLAFRGLQERRQLRMESASRAFEGERDPGVSEALASMLQAAHADVRSGGLENADMDSVASDLLQGHMGQLTTPVDAALRLLDGSGNQRGSHYLSDGQKWSREELSDELRGMGTAGPVVVPDQVGDRVRFAGVAEFGDAPVKWALAMAEPHVDYPAIDNSPLMHALVASGVRDQRAGLSFAAFYGGTLVHSVGRSFRRHRLDGEVASALELAPRQWRKEELRGRQYETYYRQLETPGSPPRILAVRASAYTTFDHLYYLLRLTVAGLLVGLPCFLAGLFWRARVGLLPAQRVHFRDRVLNAFLVVGIIAVTTVGFVGVEVVTEENDRAVQSWLRQHLQSIEATLEQEAAADEPVYSVLERVSLDSLSARAGLDLVLYRDGDLVGTSRERLVEERIVDSRLPIEVHQSLELDGYSLAFVENRLGALSFTSGYRALLDGEGQTRFVLSVPALPEQERIDEERARTLAYLFGALLVILVLVMATASLLANALARPIARLRAGLAAAARGRFEQMPAMASRDEVGELVETFNEMQSQLSESRRRLARQERQLAWREMARQVAHEIKNPLTPMKLSVQHLRRALEEDPPGTSGGRFRELFDRITVTLVHQMDAMARIANEFASFARMPPRTVETLDLAEVIGEAVSLMQEEAPPHVELRTELVEEALHLEADREELRRIYINLVKNALEAVRDREAGVVTLTAQAREDGTIYSTVADTGPGIPQDLWEHIFEPSFSTKTSGTGLGLAIARRSVEDLGGEIGFRTSGASGTVFWLRLPLGGA